MKNRRAFVVVDLGFGDAGKGSMVDYLVRTTESRLVVRFNGGAQAAHNVLTPDGLHHTFSQFGAGTLAGPNVYTYLSKHFVLHPIALVNEYLHLRKIGAEAASARLLIDERALVITPYQQGMNRIREIMRGENRHGSCGVGVGETVSDSLNGLSLRVWELFDKEQLRKKMAEIRDRKLAVVELLHSDDKTFQKEFEFMRRNDLLEETVETYYSIIKCFRIERAGHEPSILKGMGDIIFEGAQGALIDEKLGFYPHTTWSNCTTANAREVLGDAKWEGDINTIGVLRAYATRHGAGPFPTYDYRLSQMLPDKENSLETVWQGDFRCGWFDAVLGRYAINANGKDIQSLAITCLDRVQALPELKMAIAYTMNDKEHFDLEPPGVWTEANMEKFGQRIAEAKPLYTHYTPSKWQETKFLQDIEAQLRVPIKFLSYGPTWRDKKAIGWKSRST